MHFFAALAQLALVALPILATLVTRTEGKTAGHIIKLKDGVDSAAHLQSLSLAEGSSIVYDYSIINAYFGNFNDAELAQLKAHNDVEYVEEDGIVSILESENNNPWGLNRISTGPKLQNQDPSQLTFNYTYDGLGEGVDIYVLDTGIYVDHPAFGGRAVWGRTFVSSPDIDDNGHGTHCAGTAISSPYGVAQKARAIAVKVIAGNGSGRSSDIIAGLLWVRANVRSTKRPSLVSMSVGIRSDILQIMDETVRSLITSGITVVIAAGNYDINASSRSPTDVQEAIVVGASDIKDSRAPFSNWGPAVDLFAPGVGIISTSKDGGTASKSGTSMAASHVAGQAAIYLAANPFATPADVSTALTNSALSNKLSDMIYDTPNLLLNNGFTA